MPQAFLAFLVNKLIRGIFGVSGTDLIPKRRLVFSHTVGIYQIPRAHCRAETHVIVQHVSAGTRGEAPRRPPPGSMGRTSRRTPARKYWRALGVMTTPDTARAKDALTLERVTERAPGSVHTKRCRKS